METTVNVLPNDFWGTMTPYYVIALLLIVATVACYIPIRSKLLRWCSAIVVPAMLLIAGYMEIVLFSKLGADNVVWWCDLDHVGFFSALLRLFPFVLVLFLQIHSFFAYQNFVFGPQLMDEPGASISLRPKFKRFWWLFLVVVAAGVADRMGLKGNTLNMTIGLITVLVLFIIFGSYNFEEFGVINGTLLTFFAVVYIIGLLLAAYAFIIVLLKVFWQILIWAVFGGFVLWYMKHTDFAEEHRKFEKRREDEERMKINRGE